MDRAPAIRENGSGGHPGRAWRLWVLSAVGLLLSGSALWTLVPRTPPERPFELRGLKLVDTVVHLPTASFKLVDFALPCAGTLALELTCEGENNIDVFVVAPSEVPKMKARQTFSHLDGFDARLAEKYQRTARLAAGKYCLVLMDKSSGRLGSSRTLIQVHARLSELN